MLFSNKKSIAKFTVTSLYFFFRKLSEFHVPAVDILEESFEVFPTVSPSCTSLWMALLDFHRARWWYVGSC